MLRIRSHAATASSSCSAASCSSLSSSSSSAVFLARCCAALRFNTGATGSSSTPSSAGGKSRVGVGKKSSATSRSSMWTSLLEEDNDAQVGNAPGKETVLGKMHQRQVEEIKSQTPPEMRHYVDEKGGTASKRRFVPNFDATNKEFAEQEAAAEAAGVGADPTWFSKAFRRMPPPPTPQQKEHQREFTDEEYEEMQRQEMLSRQQQQDQQQQQFRRAPSAVSRFFREAEANEFAAKKYEDEDKNRFGIKSPVMKRDSETGTIGLETADGRPMGGGAVSAGGNLSKGYDQKETPYDAYRNFAGTQSGNEGFLADEKTRAHQSMVPGLGFAASALQFAVEKGTSLGQTAEMPKDYAIRKPQLRDNKLSLRKRVFADFDVWDRRSTTHVLTSYSSAEWIFAAASVAIIYWMTEYQHRNNILKKYDEFLGIDIQRIGDAASQGEYIVVLLMSMLFYRLFLYHPVALGVIGGVRAFRYSIGMPMGP